MNIADKEGAMDSQQKQKLIDDIFNKRIVDYGNYRIIYNISNGEISIYENAQCVMKKSNIKEVIAFFTNNECNKRRMYKQEQSDLPKDCGRCLERDRDND